jgi:hypothetical protein
VALSGDEKIKAGYECVLSILAQNGSSMFLGLGHAASLILVFGVPAIMAKPVFRNGWMTRTRTHISFMIQSLNAKTSNFVRERIVMKHAM